MAIMKLTAFNAGLRGKINGTVFQSGPFGQVAKSKALLSGVGIRGKLTKADAGLVIPIRTYIAQLATGWKGLSGADQLTWRTGAVNFPFKNKFGDAYTASGYQVYMSLNLNLLAAGQSPRTTCPSPAIISDAPAFTVAYVGGGPSLMLNGFGVNPYVAYTLYATRSFSAGRLNQASNFKAIYLFPLSYVPPFDIINLYEAIFGTLPSQGNIWFRLTATDNVTGQAGTPYNFNLQY